MPSLHTSVWFQHTLLHYPLRDNSSAKRYPLLVLLCFLFLSLIRFSGHLSIFVLIWSHNESVMYSFTKLSSGITSTQLMAMLNNVYSTFDDLADKYKVYKVRSEKSQLHIAAPSLCFSIA